MLNQVKTWEVHLTTRRFRVLPSTIVLKVLAGAYMECAGVDGIGYGLSFWGGERKVEREDGKVTGRPDGPAYGERCLRTNQKFPDSLHLMGMHLMGMHLMGVHLIGRASYERVPHEHAFHRRTSHKLMSYPIRR
jgi:hypothetical protein